MSFVLFNFFVLLLGLFFIFLSRIVTKEEYAGLLATGTGPGTEYLAHRASINRSMELMLRAIGLGIIAGLGVLASLGLTLWGVLLTFNVVFGAVAAYLVRIRKYLNGGRRTGNLLTILFFFAVILAFNYGVYASARPVGLTLHPNRLTIHAVFGSELNRSAIARVFVADELPEISHKHGGFALGKYKRGAFALEGGGRAYLYAETGRRGYLRIDTKTNTTYYFNYNAADEAQRELLRRYGKAPL